MDGVSNFYIGCFLFGFFFSGISFLFGFGHMLGLHLPFGHGSHAVRGIHAGHAAHVTGHGAPMKGLKASTREGGVSPLNSLTLATFLTWFGGVGYLLHYYTGLPPLPINALAATSGFAGGGVIFWGISKLYAAGDKPMDPALFERLGTVARVSAAIPADGTGEIFYTKGGSSFTHAAKSARGVPLPKGSEVVITDFKNGMAWVELYEQFVFGDGQKPGEASPETEKHLEVDKKETKKKQKRNKKGG